MIERCYVTPVVLSLFSTRSFPPRFVRFPRNAIAPAPPAEPRREGRYPAAALPPAPRRIAAGRPAMLPGFAVAQPGRRPEPAARRSRAPPGPAAHRFPGPGPVTGRPG